jgi:hypothetical protein
MMKNLFKILAATLLVLVVFNGCKKDDNAIPDVTGSTYEVYKNEVNFLGTTTTNIANTDDEYYQWKFVSGGKLQDKDGVEIGTWTQNGEDLTVVYLIITYNCKISGNEIVASYSVLGIGAKDYLRKI